ncbi:MAG: hypothetical protein NDI61_10100 [Bdellovibrionaceae bacterium]|nr:hypothetical protein [Pseudobdellovibrionaceae bacterium]
MLLSKNASAATLLLTFLTVPALAQVSTRAPDASSLATTSSAAESTAVNPAAVAPATATLQVPASAVSAPTRETKKTSLSVSAGVTGKSMEDKWVNSKWAGGQVGLTGSREFFEIMQATLDVGFLMTAGTFSNQYGSEGSAPTAFWLNQASLSAQPFSFFKLEAGVLPMAFSSLPSALDAPGFPALRENLMWEGRSLGAELFAVQAIPSSGTGAVKPSENGITTSFTAIGANLSSSEQTRAALTFKTSVLRYDFYNLNASAATDSQYLGNSIVAPGPQARFKYAFGGYEAAGELKLRMGSRWSARTTGAAIRNEKAPAEFGRGYQYTGGLGYKWGDREVTVSSGYFYNQADTLPGTYASLGKGFNNRFGNTARIGFEDVKEKITGFVQYVRSNEILDRPYTADRDTVTFGLEAAYDVL